MRSLLFFCFFCGTLVSKEPSHILFLIKRGETERAIKEYMHHRNEVGHHEPELLEEMAISLLHEGITSSNTDVQMMSMFGAKAAKVLCPLHIFEEGLNSQSPYVQAAALGTVAEMHEDYTDDLILEGMHSKFLMIRVQTAYFMAQRAAKGACGQIESLMRKLPPQFWAYFPELYAQLETSDARALLKSLLNHQLLQVRLATLFAITKFGRDDLLPSIRALSTHVDPFEQEMAAFSLGHFGDIGSKKQLEHLAKSPSDDVKLAALYALMQIGEEQHFSEIVKMAEKKNLFAVYLLHKWERGKDILAKLVHDRDINVRLNATVALLKLKEVRALGAIAEFLLKTPSDLGFEPQLSAGSSLRAWRVKRLASAQPKEERERLAMITRSFRQELLVDSMELGEKIFMHIARKIFYTRHRELIPTLVRLLENQNSPCSLELLRSYSKEMGMPLTRAYCNLALYRLKADGFDQNSFIDWIHNEQGKHLIQFEKKSGWKRKKKALTSYELAPAETSQLLFETYEAIATAHEPNAIDLLLDAMAYGNEQNRFALAGLLLIALQ
ncbi:MAG: HEAT repeat domain-containing protein [Candidatus Algichlamydia australiensis]|nr:HEAT repeat domain-containing protein [Chlamydiales bacterium]